MHSDRAAGWTIRESNPGRKERFFFFSPRDPYELWEPLTGVLYPEVNRLGPEVDHSLPSGSETKNEWSCTSTPFMCLHGVGKDNFNCG